MDIIENVSVPQILAVRKEGGENGVFYLFEQYVFCEYKQYVDLQ